MKMYIFYLLILISISSCDYESVLLIENNRTENITIKTEGNPIQEYGNIKLINSEDDTYEYELEQESQHVIIQLINEDISTSNIPFSKLEIYTSLDTVSLNNRTEIFETMTTVWDNYFKITID